MDISQIIEQDIKAAYSAFRNDDFRLVNIFANRIMTNAILTEDSRPILIGFFLKDMALIYERIKAREDVTTISTAKSFGDVYLKSTNLKIDINGLWAQYHRFYENIRKYEQDPYERESYEKNAEFTSFSFNWLIGKLNSDKNVLFYDNNQFVLGILNEMIRIFKVHGGEISDFYALSLVKALKLYCDYLEYFSKNERSEIINRSLFPYVDEIAKTVQKNDPKDITLLLKRIIIDWRIFYIYFMERPQLVSIPEEGVPISAETKRLISESVAKTLEKEVK